MLVFITLWITVGLKAQWSTVDTGCGVEMGSVVVLPQVIDRHTAG
jgi:hypothetical protein